MSKFLSILATTWLPAVGVTAVGIGEYFVEDHRTAQVLEQLVPAPYTQLVPAVLASVALYLVHRKATRKATKAATAAAAAAPVVSAATPAPVLPADTPAPAPAPAPAPSLSDLVRQVTPATTSSAPTSVVQLVGLPGGR